MGFRNAAHSESSDAARSLEWTAAIEETTRAIPPPRALARFRRRREYAFDDSVATAVDFRGSALFVNPHTDSSLLLDPVNALRMKSTATADVVLAGALRTARLLRFRAFYMEPALSLAVQRREGATPSALVRGSKVQASLTGRTPFVVPRVLETGHFRPRKADWLVEEALDGAPIARANRASTARELLALLPDVWERFGVEHTAVDDAQRHHALAEFTALAQEPPDGIWPGDVSREAALRDVAALLADTRLLTVGVRHGDPGVGNLLRLTDGRLALIDWEYADHGSVAFDVMKVLLSAPNPVELAASLPAPPVGAAAHVMPWRRQVATTIVLFLRGWRYRRTKALRRGSGVGNQQRMQRTIQTLSALLDD